MSNSKMKVLDSWFVELLHKTLIDETADGTSCTRSQLAESLNLDLRVVTAAVDLAMIQGQLVGFSSRRGPGGGLVPDAVKTASEAKKAEKAATVGTRKPRTKKKSSKGRKSQKVAEAIVADDEVVTSDKTPEAAAV